LAADLPELPDAKKARFMRDYGLSGYDAGVLVAERELADYYERAVSIAPSGRDPKLVANWITGDLAAYANSVNLAVPETQITPEQIADLVDLIADGTISGKIAKDVLLIIAAEDRDDLPRAIVASRGLKQVTDQGAIAAAIDRIMAANPDKVAQVQAKPTMLGWFVGQVMKATEGKANPQAVNALLREKLGI
jgi:aspartyl-tRNA(Asn)/glutamyl-tRNA(Gln) amidotransferase subunit B